MYLAPLNYDRYFRKVFSDKNIAKAFIEDFLDVIIEEIELLPQKHKMTDAAKSIKYDFRCKINGQYIIIDMQQWYERDVIHRFYTYHAASTALQLESLPSETLAVLPSGEKIKKRNYEHVLPVCTLIWMVHDRLDITHDYLAYTMLPEDCRAFLLDEQLWIPDEKAQKNLLKQRNKIVDLIHADAKGLQFLGQNRLIYMFQKNIIKNKKHSKYFDWFAFAAKTSDPENKREDFTAFRERSNFESMIMRLNIENAPSEELAVLADYARFVALSEENVTKSKELAEKNAIIQQKNETIQQKNEAIQQKDKALQQKEIELKNFQLQTILNMHQKGMNIDTIANIMNKTQKEIEQIIQQNK